MKQETESFTLEEQLSTLSAAEKREVLQGEAIRIEEGTISIPLDNELRLRYQEDLAKNSIDLAIKQSAFDEIKQEFKTEMQPIKLLVAENISVLRANAIEQETNLYSVPNQESGQLETYSENGKLQNSRPLAPDENQMTISGGARTDETPKTGTD